MRFDTNALIWLAVGVALGYLLRNQISRVI